MVLLAAAPAFSFEGIVDAIFTEIMDRGFSRDQRSFVQSLEATWPFYVGRLLGGSIFFLGMLVMAYNVARTISQARTVESGGNVSVLAGGRA